MAILGERKLVLEKLEVQVEENQEEIRRLRKILEEKEALHQEAIDTERDYRIAKLRKEVERNRHSCSRGLGYSSLCIGNKLRDKTNDDIVQPVPLEKVKKEEGKAMPLWSSSRGCA
jgi:hypothetical protein